MKWPLEKINKNILLVALALLLFRAGSFSMSHIPDPFEIVFVVLVALTAFDILKNRKGKEFCNSVPKKIWIGIACLAGSIFLGWVIALFEKIPQNFNIVVEFATLAVAVGTFVLVLFYTRHEKEYVKKYLCALCLPVVFIVFIFFPGLASTFHLIQNGVSFNGLTTNLNIFSKTMLVPAIVFAVQALFERKNFLLKAFFVFLASGSFALILWAAERGAILSFVTGLVIAAGLFFSDHFHWKKMASGAAVLVTIIILGFVMVPYSGKKVAIDRIFNFDARQTVYTTLKNESLSQIVASSIDNPASAVTHLQSASAPASPATVSSAKTIMPSPADSRLAIWPFYLNYELHHPLGIGPDTHIALKVKFKNTVFVGLGPTNSYLQIFLWGGIPGLASFLFIIGIVVVSGYRALKKNMNPVTVAVTGSFLALLISISFNDTVYFYWFWIVAALVLSL